MQMNKEALSFLLDFLLFIELAKTFTAYLSMIPQFWTLDCQCQITLGIIQALGGSNTSMLISPSMTTALVSLAYIGAGDLCIPEMYQFATCGQSFSSAHQNVQMFMPRASKYDEYGQVYVQNGVILKPEYLGIFKEVPELGLNYVDFQDPKTLRLINAGISNFTGQKIKQIVNKFDPDLELFLLGAAAIVDKWEVAFNEPANGTFFINEHANKTVLMMQQTSNQFGFSESTYFYGLRLAFNSSLSKTSNRNCKLDINRTTRTKDCDTGSLLDTVKFLLFLPKERFGLAKALPHLNGDVITNLLNTDAGKMEVNLILPTLNFTFSTGLKDVLPKIGLKRGFDRNLADFSRMSNQKVYIGDIVQTTTIEITSNGMDVETAGATKMIRQKRFSPTQASFEANQPFIYLITSNDHVIEYAGVFT